MAGIAAESELTAPRPSGPSRTPFSRHDEVVRFELATRADDPELRRLLRENPMAGRIGITLEREPDASLAAAIEGDVHHTIVARDMQNARLIAMGSVSVRERYVNGEPSRVGYLGQLRLDHRCRPRARVILAGYRKFRELHESLGVKLYLTSIAADNAPARRLLERGLPGMPTYRPLCEFVTVVLPVAADTGARRTLRRLGFSLRHGTPELLDDASAVLHAQGAVCQFAPVWSGHGLRRLASQGLRDTQFRIVYQGDAPVACAAVWDQRAMKQTVVRSYPTALRLTRRAVNLLAPLTGLPRLPPIGGQIRFAFLSHVATPTDRPELVGPLIELLHASARTLGVDCLAAGFDARDPRLDVVRRLFGAREYRTKLYVVHWPEGVAAADALDASRLAAPEVALL